MQISSRRRREIISAHFWPATVYCTYSTNLNFLLRVLLLSAYYACPSLLFALPYSYISQPPPALPSPMVLPQDDWSQSPPPDEKVDELAPDQKDKPKKPRHRHSAFQLAALNELYEQNDHPPLQARTSLAERLGM